MLPLYLFSKDWFGLHPNEEEIIVDRSAIDGVALIDSVWDISELEIIDTGIEYKVKRTGENKFTLREGGTAIISQLMVKLYCGMEPRRVCGKL